MKTENLIQLLKLTKVDKANEFCILSYDDGILSTRTNTPDSSLLTKIFLKDNFPINQELGIRDMDKLVKMLGLHAENVDLKVKASKLHITDGKMTSEYALSSLKFLKPKKLTFTPKYDAEIELTEEVIHQLIQSMKVLSDSKYVSLGLSGTSSVISIGDNLDHTNSISFSVPVKIYVEDFIYEIFYLNLQLVKQLIETNSKCKTGKLLIAHEGLTTFEFTYDNIVTEYHLIMMEV